MIVSEPDYSLCHFAFVMLLGKKLVDMNRSGSDPKEEENAEIAKL